MPHWLVLFWQESVVTIIGIVAYFLHSYNNCDTLCGIMWKTASSLFWQYAVIALFQSDISEGESPQLDMFGSMRWKLWLGILHQHWTFQADSEYCNFRTSAQISNFEFYCFWFYFGDNYPIWRQQHVDQWLIGCVDVKGFFHFLVASLIAVVSFSTAGYNGYPTSIRDMNATDLLPWFSVREVATSDKSHSTTKRRFHH